MNKKIDKKTVLKKEHFEILLEDINDKLNIFAEGYTLLNNKIYTKIDQLTNELHSTRDELIFLIKASVEHSEERLEKKIEEGDKKVIAYLEKKIEDGDKKVIAYLEKKIEDGDKAIISYVDKRFDGVDKRLDLTNQKLDEINNSMQTHTVKLYDHEERISILEHKH